MGGRSHSYRRSNLQTRLNGKTSNQDMWCIKYFYSAWLQWYCNISGSFNCIHFLDCSSQLAVWTWSFLFRLLFFFTSFSQLTYVQIKMDTENIRQKESCLWLRILPLGCANHITAVPRNEVCLCQTCGGHVACFPDSTIRFMDWNGTLSLGDFVVKWYTDGTILNLVMNVVTHILSAENNQLL